MLLEMEESEFGHGRGENILTRVTHYRIASFESGSLREASTAT